MRINQMSMLTDWLDWALHPRHPERSAAPAPNPEYEALLACYRSEQMTIAQLWAHMDEDPAFRAFVEARLSGASGVDSRTTERLHVHH